MIRKHRENGFSLVQVVVGSGIAGVMALGMIALFAQTAQQQRRSNVLTQMDLVRRNIVNLALTDAAWDRTINAAVNIPARLNCLIPPGTPCTTNGLVNGPPVQDQPFALFDAASPAPYFNSLLPTSGFTATGTPCASFSAAGNDACPFRFDLTWTAVCAPGNCVNPQVRISATAVYRALSPGTDILFNPANYSIPALFRATPAAAPAAIAAATWTPTPRTSLGTYNENATGIRSFSLATGGIPATATEVLIYMYCNTGNTNVTTPNTVKIYTQEGATQYAHYFFYKSYAGQSAWAYNSDNFWFPVTSDRRIYVDQSDAAGTMNVACVVYTIGYR